MTIQLRAHKLYELRPFRYIDSMGSGAATHRTTVDIEVESLERAKEALGTHGYKDTINEALRHVEREHRLRRGAMAILGEELDLATPEDLEEMRRPRVS